MLIDQAVLLAGGTGSRLYPLNSTGTPKALLPVGNEPLISFPLKSLEEAGVREVFVICFGEASATKVHSWISKHYSGKLQLAVRSIPEDSSGSHTAGALKAVASKLTGDHFLVVSGDIVTDIPLKALVATHYLNSSICTSLLTRRKTSAAAETKPGKAPTNVDFVGLDENHRHLLFFECSSEVGKRSVKVALPLLEQSGALTIQTDLVDQHCHVFDSKAVFQALEAKPTISAIKEREKEGVAGKRLLLEQDLVPYLVRHQAKAALSLTTRADSLASSLPSGDNLAASLACPQRQHGGRAAAFIAPEGHFCARANTLAAYADVNREVIGAELASKFLPQRANAEGYFRHDSVAVAPRTTVAAGCMLGKGSRVGEKCTIKRSVLGQNCSLGANVKLINSVLMDRVTVDENCVVQNCILCSGSHLQAHVQLRDCQVGPDYTVPEGVEHRGETFDRSRSSLA